MLIKCTYSAPCEKVRREAVSTDLDVIGNMDYNGLVDELRFLSKFVPEESTLCDDDGKDTLEKAADAIETLMEERNGTRAHVVVNWLGDCHCSNCAKNIDSTSNYCNWCGAKLDEPEQKEQ